ncbi:hypothetical protein MKZ74_12695 [Staphylococcus haemolyticus]|uniref:hypothetical protein n=1 Tax=Staphylococcus haemolyticus TaxID=1283 RepID=UPI001F5CEA36|nr:hypothetical protein [Staphylococcus haemolyticus]MCI3140203.1 hypothetical protein [Staphylococcus haemolyticus]
MNIRELLVIATNNNNVLEDVSKFELSQLYKLEYEKYIKIIKVRKQGFNKRIVQFEEAEYFKYILEGKPSNNFTEAELDELENLRTSIDLEFHDELHYLMKKYPDAGIKDNINMVEETEYNIKWKQEHNNLMSNYHSMNELEKARALNKSKRLLFYILMYQPAILKVKGIL